MPKPDTIAPIQPRIIRPAMRKHIPHPRKTIARNPNLTPHPSNNAADPTHAPMPPASNYPNPKAQAGTPLIGRDTIHP